MPQLLPGLATVIDQYDFFILDLWGVVHNGHAPYPGAPECMKNLCAVGKTVVLLSNAPRRATTVKDFLHEKIGLPSDCYNHVVTSGDLTYRALATDQRGWQNYLRIGPEHNWSLLDGLPYRWTEDVTEADFVLCTGLFDDENDNVSDYDNIFKSAIAHDLTLVCANPDLTVMRGTKMILCAGSLAQRYEQLGGHVELHGKPYPDAYVACRALSSSQNVRMLAVGDSLRTDIAGANKAEIDSALIAGGIHADEWGIQPGEMPNLARVRQTIGDGPSPTYLMPSLIW